jgi:hypothetical protein
MNPQGCFGATAIAIACVECRMKRLAQGGELSQRLSALSEPRGATTAT